MTPLHCTIGMPLHLNFVCLGFVGLVNQAMTCYLNSLLQTLYMTPEFRNAMYRFVMLYIGLCAFVLSQKLICHHCVCLALLILLLCDILILPNVLDNFCELCCSWQFTGTDEEGAKSIPYQLQRLFVKLQVLLQMLGV